jgi:Ras GTPase-activating-like protein IQGAP2/3
MQKTLDASGLAMPSFGNVDKSLEKEMSPFERSEDARMQYLHSNIPKIVVCQSYVRRHLAGKKRAKKANDLQAERKRQLEEDHKRKLNEQARIAAEIEAQRENINKTESAVRIQAQVRGFLTRATIESKKQEFKRHMWAIIAIQSFSRGFLARKRCNQRRSFYQKNESTIITIQSWLKSKQQHSAYNQLTTTGAPSLEVISKFIHLLDIGIQDLEIEIQLENQKQVVVKQIRENAALEQHLNELDMKIALLVKNRTTLDEVVKASSKKVKKTVSDEELGSAAELFTRKNADKQSKDRVESYQVMFYLLQTQSKYLTKLLSIMQLWNSDSNKKLVENSILTVFSYAQNPREEFLLLKLLECAIQLEVQGLKDIGDFVKGNPTFIKMVLQYVRGAKERHFLQSVLQTPLAEICSSRLDLELDPINVYKILIKEEEVTTGLKSSKTYDVSKDEALLDAKVMDRIRQNYATIEGFVNTILHSIVAAVGRMPYGIRYVSQQLFQSLSVKFPSEKPSSVLRVVGNLIYYRYMNPAVVSPEAFDVYTQPISSLSRKNLSEVSKILNIIATGKQLDSHLYFASPFVSASSQIFLNFLEQVKNIPTPEIQLNVDIYADAAGTKRPVIYISPNEIFSMHSTLYQHMNEVCPDEEDPMRHILVSLGPSPSYQQDKTGVEIALSLKPTFSGPGNKESTELELRRLFVATKKQVILIVRVHPSESSLMDLLEGPSTEEDEIRYSLFAKESSPMYPSTTSLNASGNSLNAVTGKESEMPATFAQFKVQALEAMAKLEQGGLVSRKDRYQSMLSSIAQDMRNKHRRRQVMEGEKLSLDGTLQTLLAKKAFLLEQEKSYSDYINSCIQQLTAHQGSKRKKSILPFTRHSRHLRELEKQKKEVPKFGSFKYSAKELMDRGVVQSIDAEGLPSKLYDKLDITLSSKEQGVIDIECSFRSIGITIGSENDTVKLEDLLSLQFENKAETKFFDGSVTVNVNLFIYFINKKYVNLCILYILI